MLDYKISVVNKYKATLYEKVFGVDIGRGSPFGNPYKMENNSEKERDRVCRDFKLHLWKSTQDANSTLNSALTLLYEKWRNDGYLILLCYCAPKKCHGHIISRYLEWKHATLQELGGIDS